MYTQNVDKQWDSDSNHSHWKGTRVYDLCNHYVTAQSMITTHARLTMFPDSLVEMNALGQRGSSRLAVESG